MIFFSNFKVIWGSSFKSILYMSELISAKNKINRRGDSFFFNWKFEKKSSMTGHPIWIVSQKFEFVFFSFLTLKDLSNMISYLYFGYLDQKLYLKKKFMSNFWHKTCFFQKSVFWQKKFGEMSSFMVLERFKIQYIFFWAKSDGQIFFWCSVFFYASKRAKIK
jgi:hypothetical protein